MSYYNQCSKADHVRENLRGLSSLYLGFLRQYLASFLWKLIIHLLICASKGFESTSVSFTNTIFPIRGC